MKNNDPFKNQILGLCEENNIPYERLLEFLSDNQNFESEIQIMLNLEDQLIDLINQFKQFRDACEFNISDETFKSIDGIYNLMQSVCYWLVQEVQELNNKKDIG